MASLQCAFCGGAVMWEKLWEHWVLRCQKCNATTAITMYDPFVDIITSGCTDTPKKEDTNDAV